MNHSISTASDFHCIRLVVSSGSLFSRRSNLSGCANAS